MLNTRMLSFISTTIKLGLLNKQRFTYSITFKGAGHEQVVLCEIFYPMDPDKMEQRVSTVPQNVELFNFTAEQKSAEEIERHREELGGDLLSIGTMTPNPKINASVVVLVNTITTKFGLLSVNLLQIFPYLWQEDSEFHFKIPLATPKQVERFFEEIQRTV